MFALGHTHAALIFDRVKPCVPFVFKAVVTYLKRTSLADVRTVPSKETRIATYKNASSLEVHVFDSAFEPLCVKPEKHSDAKTPHGRGRWVDGGMGGWGDGGRLVMYY